MHALDSMANSAQSGSMVTRGDDSFTNSGPAASSEDHVLVVVARSEELRRQCFRLRYEVFCEELDIMPTSAYPDRLEKDELDERADTILIGAFADGRAKGTLRLLLGNSQLPIEAHLDLAALGIDRRATAEVSRLAIARSDRNNLTAYARFRWVYEYARHIKLTHLCCQNAVGMQRYYRRLGFATASDPYNHELIGPAVAMVCPLLGGRRTAPHFEPGIP